VPLTHSIPAAATWQANAGEARQGEPAASRPALHSRAVDAAAREVPEADYLARFFVRYNRVLLDQAVVDREKARLQQQNEQLRARWDAASTMSESAATMHACMV
jgi:hypothetical protein